MLKHSVSFKLQSTCTKTRARRGCLTTLRGSVQTPAFMPVGTVASVKGLDAADLHQLGTQMMLCNAYHLLLRPGPDLIAEAGGLHRFMNFKGSILTDSGGFQVFSLSQLRKISDAGVVFRSHLNGELIELSPERLVAVQEALGPDVAMVLDECPPAQAPEAVVQTAMARSTAWAKRCLAARTKETVSFFGIVQGAVYPHLRKAHVEELCSLPFPGFAIGGVSVGEPPAEIHRIVDYTAPLLPADKPRYLMGVGTPTDIIHGVASGVDMFDCVLPSRNARNGQLFTMLGKINIKNTRWRGDHSPLCSHCSCHTCQHYSKAYLRHLFVAKELSYYRLATIHNLAYYSQMMSNIRADLEAGSFDPRSYLESAQAIV